MRYKDTVCASHVPRHVLGKNNTREYEAPSKIIDISYIQASDSRMTGSLTLTLAERKKVYMACCPPSPFSLIYSVSLSRLLKR